MSIFGSILNALHIGTKKEETPAPTPTASAPRVVQPIRPPTPIDTGAGMAARAQQASRIPQPAPTPKPVAIAIVDVAKQLDALAAASKKKGETLNWKVSIVDMLKLLGIDSSYNARKELAKELGCPDLIMADSAQMNVWLHKTVMQKIAENGGNIPKELLS